MSRPHVQAIAGLLLLLGAGPSLAAPRSVQIRSVDLSHGVIELFNFGATDMPLDGWRFCTHDENKSFQYSGTRGLDGRIIPAGSSFFIHFDNDSPGGPNHINRSALGRFATPLDAGSYAVGLFFPPVQFFDGDTLADHVQWSIDGVGDAIADERSDEAEDGGVWRDQTEWVSTTPDTRLIVLNDLTGRTLHGPDDYDVIGADRFGDWDGDFDVDLGDLLAFQACHANADGEPVSPKCGAIFDGDDDGDVDLADYLEVQRVFTGPRSGDGPRPTETARYTVTFDSVWSPQTHPTNFPGNSHYSGLVGATHNDNVHFWRAGELASPGIKDMAERGRKDPLRNVEIAAAMQDSRADQLLSGGGIGPSPGSTQLGFDISLSHRRVTLVAMIAPSPDWFVGVDAVSLFVRGDWVDELVAELHPYDAGTDSGVTYGSANQVTSPPEPISRITGFPFLLDDTVLPLGTFTFRRID